MTKARPYLGRRRRTDVEGADEAQDDDGEATISDLDGMLGRGAALTLAITNQQWLAFHLIKF